MGSPAAGDPGEDGGVCSVSWPTSDPARLWPGMVDGAVISLPSLWYPGSDAASLVKAGDEPSVAARVLFMAASLASWLL